MRLDGPPCSTSPKTTPAGFWLATSNGVVRVDGRQLTPMFGGGPTLADAVMAVAFDREGALWAGTYDSGLWRYKDGALEHFTQKQRPVERCRARARV